MIFIIAYKLKRKNARRKIYAKLDVPTVWEAVCQFESYCNQRPKDEKLRDWELLSGDWKHIAFFCPTCKRCMDDKCKMCNEYKEGNVNNG